jgi:hypothetical protein
VNEIDLGALSLDVLDEGSATQRTGLERTSDRAMASMLFELSWQSANARHIDRYLAPKLNLWRDILPSGLEQTLMDQPVGFSTRQAFSTGELPPPYQASDCLAIDSQAFNRRFRKHNHIEPRNGRFYPRGFIAGTRGIHREERQPFRVGEVGERITVDLNHPLADAAIEVRASILDISAARDEHGGACNDVAELITASGPGMQGRWRGLPTDFFSDIPFSRMAPEPDAAFYDMPRLVHHLDSTARDQISRLYGRLIPPHSRVLDLMSSWVSHLPDELDTQEVIGLGMNAEELQANAHLSEWRVHDLNLEPALPYQDAAFDAVICTVSVEYLTKPLEVFAEVARVLRPGGRFILTFSDRWFPPKVIKVWHDIHPFERMGLVLEYFLRSDAFDKLHSWSQRGLPRPLDDKYADRMALSDPVFAVWGERRTG